MKLKIGDKVFLQKYEVAYFVHNPDGVPGSIFNEIFCGGPNGNFFYMNGPEDGYRFDCVFKDPDNVDWLMAQGWLVDFDVFSKMELEELEDLFERLNAEYRTGIEEFNAKDYEYRQEHHDEKFYFFDRLGHKIVSLGELLKYRKGKAEFVFPTGHQSTNAVVVTTKANTSAKKKKPGFFARLFSRSSAQ